jgi:hypothetical protein
MKANAVNSIKNLLSNKLANTNFASPTKNHIITDSLAEILAQELPNPSEISFYNLSFYNPHPWVIDSAHGVETIPIIMDTTYQEFEDNQEETLLKSLNTEIGTEFGWVRFTASDIGDTLILITISCLE